MSGFVSTIKSYITNMYKYTFWDVIVPNYKAN